MNKSLSLITIVLGGIILADLIANPKGTSAFLTGIGKMVQIITNPTNTKGL